ncbi:HD domain-containing protein [uncultured Draconibacterium sp.]|uniref:HD domain-containing protein n=1 Tax=uncultured Draconibacterium sp. TaxID=1573823 RepID=UPI0025DCB3D9|nr:HD domain-containing protein [uncultured Draconibacterium sp.]
MKEIDPKKLNGCMTTVSGIQFNLLNPTIEMVNEHDIITGLSNNPHFNGQSPKFFSVAQHSVLVYYHVKKTFNRPGLSLAALLHDAAEAYTGDIIAPLKVLWPGFKQIERRIEEVIFMAFGLDPDLIAQVKPFDLKIQQMEYDQFYKGANHFPYQGSHQAYRSFMVNLNEAKMNYEHLLGVNKSN